MQLLMVPLSQADQKLPKTIATPQLKNYSQCFGQRDHFGIWYMEYGMWYMV